MHDEPIPDDIFKKLFHASPNMYVLLTPDLKIRAANKAFLDATLTTWEEIDGKDLFEVFPDNPNDPQATGVKNVSHAIEMVIKTKQPFSIPLLKYDIPLSPDDAGAFEERYWLSNCYPVFDNDNIVAMFFHVEDVTRLLQLEQREHIRSKQNMGLEQQAAYMESKVFRQAQRLTETTQRLMETKSNLEKLYEQSQKTGQARLKAIVENAIDGLITINSHGIIESFNPACERIFGYKLPEVIGKNIKMLMPDPYHSNHDGYISNYMKTGNAKIIGTAGRQVSAKRKDGTVFPIDLSISAFELEDGKHFSGIIRDITDRQQAEMELLNYTKQLERSNQELDDFAYIASHDLKEPLRGMNTQASFLIEDFGQTLGDDGCKKLNRLMQLCCRMDRLINDLLHYSRLGRTDLAIRKVDLNVLILEVQQLLDAAIKERNVSVVIPKKLPDIVCDEPKVKELFHNLITNAIKYNDKDKKTIEIGVIDEVNNKNHLEKNVFYVKDNGIGIQEKFYNDIFRMFKRIPGPIEDKEPGTGVGLTFVKKIIERHNGTIWLESQPGQGTTFYFTLGKKS